MLGNAHFSAHSVFWSMAVLLITGGRFLDLYCTYCWVTN